MTKDEIVKLSLSDPNKLWTMIKNGELDISHADFNLSKASLKRHYSMTDEQIEAVEFIYWVSYLVERSISEMISSIEKALGTNIKMIDAMLGRLHFGDKISLIDDEYNLKGQIKPFITMAWKVNSLRNNVAHGKFNDLKYEGMDLFQTKAQFKFFIDLTTAYSQSTKTE